MWSNQEYWMRARECWNRYKNQDGWFQWDPGNGDLQLLAGLKMYHSVSMGRLMPLLGDAKIRVDRMLIANFGLASGSGTEDSDQEMIKTLNNDREVIAQGAKLPSAATPIPVVGSGSILNDKKWSPLLNDSFILGGVHRGQEFHLAVEGFSEFELELQKKRETFGPVAAQYAAPGPRSPEHYQQKWKRYLIANPEVLWNSRDHVPRIFARELIGLKTFGYTPDFNARGLAFGRSSGAGFADFSQYLMALAQAGFPVRDRGRILSSISAFLFGDAGAL